MSKVPCGGFKLDNNFLSMNENDELSLGVGDEGKAYQYLVTDGDGNTKWEDRLAYEYTEWKDFTLSSSSHSDFTGFTMPPVGDTVTVKVNGVESVETVKSAEVNGVTYSYIGSVDLNSLMSGNNGWCVAYMPGAGVLGGANPETNISLIITNQHKIDEKYIPQDKNFVRPLSYYTMKTAQIYKMYYNESGDYINTYKCSNIIMPKTNERVFIYDSGDIGIGKFGSKRASSFSVDVYRFYNGTMHRERQIYGTDETEIAELAADEGYTLTTKPTT